MFNNIGKKVKNLAQWIFAIEAAASVISGIAMMESLEGFAILIIVGGLIASYFSAMIMYAFGELVDTNIDIRNKLYGVTDSSAVSDSPEKTAFDAKGHVVDVAEPEPPVIVMEKCEICGNEAAKLVRCRRNDGQGWAEMCEECAKENK